jgi:hypothetical protein
MMKGGRKVERVGEGERERERGRKKVRKYSTTHQFGQLDIRFRGEYSNELDVLPSSLSYLLRAVFAQARTQDVPSAEPDKWGKKNRFLKCKKKGE